MLEAALMRTSFRHQSEAQPPNGPLTAATSPDTPSTCPARQFRLCGACPARENWRQRGSAPSPLAWPLARALSHALWHGRSVRPRGSAERPGSRSSSPWRDARGRAPSPLSPARARRAAVPLHSRPGRGAGRRGCLGLPPCRDAQGRAPSPLSPARARRAAAPTRGRPGRAAGARGC
jgi:hypothetical protein